MAVPHDHTGGTQPVVDVLGRHPEVNGDLGQGPAGLVEPGGPEHLFGRQSLVAHGDVALVQQSQNGALA